MKDRLEHAYGITGLFVDKYTNFVDGMWITQVIFIVFVENQVGIRWYLVGEKMFCGFIVEN